MDKWSLSHYHSNEKGHDVYYFCNDTRIFERSVGKD